MPRIRPPPNLLPPLVNVENDGEMPRGGSKKGEHRGAARREAKRQNRLKNLKHEGRKPGTTTKKVRERLALIGKEIGVSEMEGVMPKDMMLDIARTFMAMALNEQKKLQEDPDQELASAYERHLVLAGDMAYKAGAYYHPRLQALMVGGASDKSPGDVLRSMLEEIDGEARLERQQVRQIEHEPTETTVEVLKVNKG